jgi:hypothetical protein
MCMHAWKACVCMPCQSASVAFGRTYWIPLRNRRSKVFYFHSDCACNPLSIPWTNPMCPRHLRSLNHMHSVPKQHDGYTSNAHLREYTYMHAYLHAGRIKPTICMHAVPGTVAKSSFALISDLSCLQAGRRLE